MLLLVFFNIERAVTEQTVSYALSGIGGVAALVIVVIIAGILIKKMKSNGADTTTYEGNFSIFLTGPLFRIYYYIANWYILCHIF